ncbi:MULTISPECIES: DUF4307 domain-containing protein [Streptomycetaceae]|uniref:DUF4307 domain-containing protein n=1 Tax=Streptantibioticus cattleyicolor (strain ATCC 35852 / DSM 46488 / JCM 4925 / NBRC 14057 / NRRL 8057) TaxID=1003195 RepID=F8K1C6_STREN|nr:MULTISPECIES: DUF4307 domain-containing protein [Streptomycetaceae]AEW96206.1 hypothetical protein SCATT_38350 [Streptantibioticus cattleyicolor NRRL 8057 = DSM 46488]MYS60726.1 DUF4307 domain-containing protein [Streptomyces sp. SID5468]CCB76540.1 putative membrane protein [Streptantibioticus cattleyicolor NRRL 8057 = DSM 46488]
MSAVRDRVPEGRYGRAPRGRYGRSADQAKDRTLRVLGTVLGGLLVVALGVGGWWYMSANDVSGQVVTFRVVSDTRVDAHLEVVKDAGQSAVCTLRSQSADQTEVGRKDVTVSGPGTRVEADVTIRTTARGTTAELLSCKAAGGR